MAPDHCFLGLDAYQKVIDSGVDVVLLATPPGFRPQHLKAAVAAGKHIFCEKPVATDAPGVRSVLETVEVARQKRLALVAGFCWRYSLPEQALFQRIHQGDIGDVQVVYGTYYTGAVRPTPPDSERKPGMTDLEWQLRNWYGFALRLSGDGLGGTGDSRSGLDVLGDERCAAAESRGRGRAANSGARRKHLRPL